MDETTTDLTLAEEDGKPSELPTLEPSKKTYPKTEISPGVRAFIHRMAENLNTHDPDVPKGRNRRY